MILDAAEALLAEQDPLTCSMEDVARAASTSRPLVCAYFGDRRGLLDALQVRLVRRLDDWVDHGLRRATTPAGRVATLVDGVFAFVSEDPDAWRLLTASGGLDHPAFHQLRSRWTEVLVEPTAPPPGDDALRAQAAVSALVMSVGTWHSSGVEPREVSRMLGALVRGDPSPT